MEEYSYEMPALTSFRFSGVDFSVTEVALLGEFGFCSADQSGSVVNVDCEGGGLDLGLPFTLILQ